MLYEFVYKMCAREHGSISINSLNLTSNGYGVIALFGAYGDASLHIKVELVNTTGSCLSKVDHFDIRMHCYTQWFGHPPICLCSYSFPTIDRETQSPGYGGYHKSIEERIRFEYLASYGYFVSIFVGALPIARAHKPYCLPSLSWHIRNRPKKTHLKSC